MDETAPKPRRKRTKRTFTEGGRITERDIAILRSVYEYRFLTASQIAILHFSQVKDTLPGIGKIVRKKATQDLTWTRKVLADLFHQGYLNRYFPPIILGQGSPKPIYSLDRAGIQLLRSHAPELAISARTTPFRPTTVTLSSEFVPHTLAINDVRILLTVACQKAGYELNWTPELQLSRKRDFVDIVTSGGLVQSIPLLPDGYCLIKTPKGSAHFFLELDRDRMEPERFQKKIKAYLAYYHREGFLARYNASKFRVLSVVASDTPQRSERRALRLKKATEEVGGRNLFWFAPLQVLSLDTILHQAIWGIAGEDSARQLFNP